jgi:membrane protein implicated in regulation of membrane protease activity
MRRSSKWIWVGRVVALLVAAALAGYLFIAGLDKAAAIAGVLGLFVAVFALVAPYLLPPGASSSVSSPDQGAARLATQLVAKSVVRGHLTQVQGDSVPGTGRLAATAPVGGEPAAGPPPAGTGGQHVTEVWVGGNLTQIDGADGDVTIG